MAMMECPRCKFLQPEDRFCANCGIDMQAYDSGPAPVYQKVFSNTWVAAVSVAAVIIGVVVFFQMQPDNEPEFGNTTLTRDEEFSKEREEKLAQQKEDSQKRRQARKDARRAAQLEQEKARDEARLARNQAISGASSKTQSGVDTTATSAAVKQLQIGFYEISRADADTLISAGEPIDEYFFKVRKANLDLLGSAQKLPGSEAKSLQDGMAISKIMSFAPSSGEISWEFALEILPSQQGDILEMTVSGGLYTTGFDNIPASFDLDPVLAELTDEEVLVLVGMIPHAPIDDPDSSGLRGSPLQVLTSEAFQTMQSDFFIVLEPR